MNINIDPPAGKENNVYDCDGKSYKGMKHINELFTCNRIMKRT